MTTIEGKIDEVARIIGQIPGGPGYDQSRNALRYLLEWSMAVGFAEGVEYAGGKKPYDAWEMTYDKWKRRKDVSKMSA